MRAVHRLPRAWYLRSLAPIALAAALALLAPPASGAATSGRPARVIIALETPAILAADDPQAEQRAVDAAQDALARTLPARGGREVARMDQLPLMVVELPAAAIAALAADPRVAAVEEDRLSQPMLAGSAPLIGAPAAWSAGHSGTGQTVVVLDTGVDLGHPFVSAAVTGGACFSSSVTYPPSSDPNAIDYSSLSLCPDGSAEQIGRPAGAACALTIVGCSHGTHVAGIAAGRAAGADVTGIAPGASVVSVQVYSRFSGRACGQVSTQAYCALSWSSDQLRALDWVYATLRSQVSVAAVNMSLGDIVPLAAPCDSSYPATQLSIQRLRDAGIPTIAAAGNGGWSDTGTPRLSAPACLSAAVAVGATDLSDSVASFSNSAPQLALLAPGVAIRSSEPGGVYGTRSGTSMAAPHVAGSWAVIRAARPDATLEQILGALSSTGQPVSDARNGLVRPRIRLDAAIDALPGPPLVLGVSTASLAFGEHVVGSASPPQSVTLSNGGTTPFQITALTITGDFARSGGSCPADGGTLAPGATCTVAITFSPGLAGPRSGSLTVSVAKLGAPNVIALSGTGRAPATAWAHVSDAEIQFGEQAVGAASAARSITISNIGGAAMQLNPLEIAGDFAQVGGTCPTAGGALAPGASCTVELAFTPTQPGPRSGSLTVTSANGATPGPIGLTGAGVVPSLPRIFLPAVSG